ncbi:MAG: M48 family metalloprotease [Planctomycetaceae bacterium]
MSADRHRSIPPHSKLNSSTPDPSRHPLVLGIPEVLPLKSRSSGYLLSLVLVAVVMLLLPLLYVGIIAGIAGATIWHLQHNLEILTAPGVKGPVVILLILVYLTPAIMGGAVVMVMLKPLLTRASRRVRPQPLLSADEPVLFAAVDRLCRALGSPIPHQVLLSNTANASASFPSWGDLLTNRPILTIGLPLVAGMPARNLLGVLAHELGHFNQYWAMRLGWIVYGINEWLTRVTLERDDWDDWLEVSSRTRLPSLSWVIHLIKGGVWLTRQILRGLRWIGVLVSRRLSRQMEYEADACEVALVGSDGFVATIQQIVALTAATNFAEQELNHLAREHRLVDNFPRLVAAQAHSLPAPVLDWIARTEQESALSWDDTHPPNRLRVEHAKSLSQPCRYAPDAPATDLFADFDGRCRSWAREIYANCLDRPVTAEELIPVDEVIAELAQTAANDRISLDYVDGVASALNRLACDDANLSTTQTAGELWSALLGARREQAHYLGPYREAAQQETNLAGERQKTELLVWALLLRQPITSWRPATVPRPPQNHEAALQHLDTIREQQNAAFARGMPFRAAWSKRLRYALQLLDAPETAALVPDVARLATERDRLWLPLLVLSETFSEREAIESRCSLLANLLGWGEKRRYNTQFTDVIGQVSLRLMQSLESVWIQLSRAPYPEQVEPRPEHLAAFCLPGIQERNDAAEVLKASRRMTSSARIVWRKSLGQLIGIATAVEQAWEAANCRVNSPQSPLPISPGPESNPPQVTD